jgi:hypothetical protein
LSELTRNESLERATGAWDINGVSVHWHTVPSGWPPSRPSEKLGLDNYAKILNRRSFIDEFLRRQEAVMDKCDQAETLIAPAVDGINPFESTNTVAPQQKAVKLQEGKISLTLAPRSITVVSFEQ